MIRACRWMLREPFASEISVLAIVAEPPDLLLQYGIPIGTNMSKSGKSSSGGSASRSGGTKRVQVKNPVSDRWVKLDTRTGRIVDTKKSPGPYKGVPRR